MKITEVEPILSREETRRLGKITIAGEFGSGVTARQGQHIAIVGRVLARVGEG